MVHYRLSDLITSEQRALGTLNREQPHHFLPVLEGAEPWVADMIPK